MIETWGFGEDINVTVLDKDSDGDNYDDENDKDNDDDKDNIKDMNNYKGISALWLDRHLEFSRGHQGRQGHQPHDDD